MWHAFGSASRGRSLLQVGRDEIMLLWQIDTVLGLNMLAKAVHVVLQLWFVSRSVWGGANPTPHG